MNLPADVLSLLTRSTTANLASNSRRLILTRWLAGVAVILATAFCVYGLDLQLPEAPLYAVGLFILGYNALLSRLSTRAEQGDRATVEARLRRVVMWQIGLDWLSMGVFLHLTGGVSSPAVVFYFIHVVMVTILLPGQSPYVYASIALLGIILIALLEAGGILNHYTPIPGMPCELCNNAYYIVSEILFLGIGLFATAFISRSIMTRLRERERQIGALLQAAEDLNSTLDVHSTLERLARHAAVALSVTGASIRLLDASGERLEMVAAHGLSRMYLEKGPVELSYSQLDREALSGRPVIIHDPANDPRIQYPREMAAEGIKSLLVAPIIGQRRPLGVLRVYATEQGAFRQEDVEFVTAIAQQGAIALENAMAHEALTRADQQRAQFVRIVTHELRAPVTGAQSLLSLLSRGYVGELSPEQADIIQRLEKRLDMLLQLINDLLAFAAGKAVNDQPALAPVDLGHALREVVEHHSPQAAHKQITLNAALPQQPILVRATHDGLVRIFDNLVGNAVKYTPAQGTVTVSVTQENSRVQVRVQDTGIGIPQEEIDRLGQEFFRASNARESEITGTGLGLAIVRQLIERFNGLLSIQSTLGEGSIFTVTLPVVAGELKKHPPERIEPE
ncbi:MAG: hypothetical protein Kow0077_20560 [Anaerolineae bacterium]